MHIFSDLGKGIYLNAQIILESFFLREILLKKKKERKKLKNLDKAIQDAQSMIERKDNYFEYKLKRYVLEFQRKIHRGGDRTSTSSQICSSCFAVKPVGV